MDEYAGGRPDELQTGTGKRAGAGRNKEHLRREVEQIRRDLEVKVQQAKEAVRETAEADRMDLERAEQKLRRIRETVKDGWDNVTEAAAAALLKLLR